MSPFDPPRSKPYPLPPMPVKPTACCSNSGARKLGYHPFPAPVAVISKAYQGRMPCQHCGWCEGFGCEHGSQVEPAAQSMIPQAIATGRCEIRPHSYVRKIEVDAKRSRNRRDLFRRAQGRKHQHAKAVISPANGAETPRLLLHVEVQPLPQRPGELQRARRQVPDVQHRPHVCGTVRARAQRLQEHRGHAHR